MDFFDGRNYRVNKILLSTVGQWPYQSVRTSHTIVIIMAVIACSQFLTKLCGMFADISDVDNVIECLSPIMIDISGITKIINSTLYVNEVRAMLDRIRDDFHSLKNSADIEILRKFADNGRRFSTTYVCVMYTLMIIFMLMPFQPLILRVANATTRPMLHRVEYYIDMEKYYFPILIHGYFTIVICVTSVVATDAIFVVFVQHVCGLFIITGSRIERTIQEPHVAGDADPPITRDKAYRNMVQCIYDHKAAARFADLMESAYSKHFLFHAGLNMVTMSITGVAVIDAINISFKALTKLDDLSELLRLIAVSGALLFHLYFECLTAQKLIDHSGYLHTNLTNLNWYDASPRTRKLVLFTMMKTRSPCVLTAGGMFVLCMETFATIVKTAVSYFTFLRSARI